MRREERPMVRLAGRWRLARLPAVAAVLVVVERALVGEVGSPPTLLRALLGLTATPGPIRWCRCSRSWGWSPRR